MPLPSASASPPASSGRRLYLLYFLALALLIATLLGYFLRLTYQQTEHGVEVSSLNEAIILSTRVDATLRRIESSSALIADTVLPEALANGSNPAQMTRARTVLQALVRNFPEIKAHRVFDAQGRFLLGSDNQTVPDIGDTDHFRQLRAHQGQGLQFSETQGSSAQGTLSLVAARALRGPKGEFLGAVITPIDLTHYMRIFSELEVGGQGMVSVRRSDDSRLVVRWPEVAPETNKEARKTPPFQLIQGGKKEGVVRYIGKSDGVDRIFAFHALGAYPFYILIGRAMDEQFQSWRNMAAMSAGLSLAALLILGFFLSRLVQSEAKGETLAAQFSAILKNANAFFLLVDKEGKVALANPSFVQASGYREAELLGKPFSRIIHDEDKAGIQNIFRQIQSGGAPSARSELRYLTRGGETAHMDVACSPILGSDGESRFILVVCQDISERKAAQAELEQHRNHLEELVAQRTAELAQSEKMAKQILESSGDGLYGLDAQGRITFINPAACEILGYPGEQMIGQEVHALIHHSYPDGSAYPAKACFLRQALINGQRTRIDNEVYWHADGHAIPIMYAAHPILQDGVVAGAVVSFVDISYQKAAEQAREKARLAAEHLARVRSEFLANMSHEIRTPLNGILGFADIGYRHHQDAARAQNAFAKIRESGTLLLGVINDILDFSKIEAGKLNIETVPTPLHGLIDGAVELLSAQARDKGIQLLARTAPDLPRKCLSDPVRIQQVLLNLLSNAVKFTPSGSVTLISALEGDSLVFQVVDTGIGMSEEQQARLFQPFEQADGSTTRKFGGTGLGLAISKRIIELMGGSITVESALNRGTTFQFRLPYQPSAQGDGDEDGKVLTRSVGNMPLLGLRILVAEDNIINQQIIAVNLEEDGAEVVLADTGLAALETVRQEGGAAFHILLMDIQMPVMNGHEATREIHKLAPDLPVVGQTAHAFAEEVDACLASGMVGHIGKPIDPEKLTEIVLRYARRA